MNRSLRIFIAGAGGTIGLPLVRWLVDAGYTVTGLTRSAWKRARIEKAGARAVVADALDASAVARAVNEASPTHLVNVLTALPPGGAPRPRDLRATNALRRHATAHLLQAAQQVRAERVISESFLAVLGRPPAGRHLRESDSMGDLPANDPMYDSILALRSLEEQHAKARRQGGIATTVLRFGFFYGPGVPSTDYLFRSLMSGRLVLPRETAGVASWIHIDDAVSAVVAALEHPDPGALYHVADDEPLRLDQAVADAMRFFEAPRPRRFPTWILRLAAPALVSMTSAYLALDNAKAKEELGWRPVYPNLRSGLADLARRRREAA